MNDHSLLGHSNLDAMDILKTALTSTDTVNLTVARKTLNATPSMAALGEEPEEVGLRDENISLSVLSIYLFYYLSSVYHSIILSIS